MPGIGRKFYTLLFVMLSMGVLAHSQTDRATITGTVKDSAGAVLSGATVTITNAATAVIFTSPTNRDGIYTIPNLPVGSYTLEVRQTGFKTYTRTGISPVAGQVITANIAMTVGAVSETVTVTGTPELEVQNASEATTMESTAIKELPLDASGGRNALQLLISTAPNVIAIQSLPQQGNQVFLSIAGGETLTNSIFIDGTNATSGYQGTAITPGQDALQEMQLQTNVTDAELAGTGGGSISFVLKSGTNKFHGSAFEILQNEDLNANPWIDNAYLSTCAAGDSACSSEYGRQLNRFNDWGGSGGGPIWKNHTFIFGDYEYYKTSDFRVNPVANTVPLTQMVTVNGSGDYDLSPLLTLGAQQGDIPGSLNPCTGGPYQYGQIFDPTTQQTVGGVLCATPFPNNQIPAGRVSSISQKIANTFAQDYKPTVNRLIGGNFPGLQNTSPEFWKRKMDFKVDHNFSERHHISASYNFENSESLGPVNFDSLAGPFGGGFQYGEHSDMMARVVDNYTIKPTLINTVSASYNLVSGNSSPTNNVNVKDWGFSWIQPVFPAVYSEQSTNGVGFTAIGENWDNYGDENSFNYADTLQWQKGRHTVKVGWQWSAQQFNGGAFTENNNAYNFSSLSGGPNDSTVTPYVGSAFSSMLLGLVDQAYVYGANRYYPRQKTTAFFGQDDFKVNPKLTLNLGLRWDITLPGHMADGTWENFDPTQTNPNWAPYTGAWVFSKNSGTTFETNVPLYQFGPHLGASYAVSPKLVARASYALTYVPLSGFSSSPADYFPSEQNPLNASSATFINNSPGSWSFDWDNGLPSQPAKPPQNGLSTTSLSTDGSEMYISPDYLKLGRANSLFVGIQYELARNVIFDTRYVGTFGRGLQDLGRGHDATFPTNWSAYDALLQSGNIYTTVNSAASAATVSSAAGITVPYPYTGFSGPAYAAISPYPQLAEQNYQIELVGNSSLRSSSNYNAFVAEMKVRNTHGMYVDWSYTISKYTSNATSISGGWGVPTNYGNVWGTDEQSPNDTGSWVAQDDQRQLAKGYFTYDMPFGDHRKWLNNSSALNYLVGGWTLGFNAQYNSGIPMTAIYSPYQLPYYYQGNQRAFFANGANANNVRNQFHRNFNPFNLTSAGNQDFPRSIVQTSSSWYYNNNTFFGDTPLLFNHWRWNSTPAQENVSLVKHFGIGKEGRYQAELRGEFYDMFNRHYFNSPDTGVSDSTFGYVTGVFGGRVGQVAARVDW